MPACLRGRAAVLWYAESTQRATKHQPVAQRRGPREPYGKWSEEKDQKLRELWGRVPRADICAAIGMTDSACYKRSIKLGLPRLSRWGVRA